MNSVVDRRESVSVPEAYSREFAGTVLWIGPTEHPEFADAFRFIQSTAPQIAVRSDQAQFLMRPATDVHLIVFVRAGRVPLIPAVAPEIQSRYANARVIVMNGALCDGERRSGQAWKDWPAVRFDRWRDWLCRTAGTDSIRDDGLPSQPLTLFLFDRFLDAEPWLAVARSQSCPAIWARRYDGLTMAGVRRIVWDETIAPKLARWDWRKAITACNAHGDCEHHWLVTQPQVADISYAVRAGICAVHSKPLCDPSFLVASK